MKKLLQLEMSIGLPRFQESSDQTGLPTLKRALLGKGSARENKVAIITNSSHYKKKTENMRVMRCGYSLNFEVENNLFI